MGDIIGIAAIVLLSVFGGWTARGTIADKEQQRRWWVEGCRHGTDGKWQMTKEESERADAGLSGPVTS